MFEKVNPMHPDKVADRIAGAIVDLAYLKNENPKIAVEILIGHGECNIIIETSEILNNLDIEKLVERISKEKLKCNIKIFKQDVHLNKNQDKEIKCGDNGIFKGLPIREEEKELVEIAKKFYLAYETDGKYIIDKKRDNTIVICQSNAVENSILYDLELEGYNCKFNPLGYWTGGLDVDTGAVNRKLGSDMGYAVTGGGIHGKDLSKADVTLNIYAYLYAQKINEEVNISCAIGDKLINGISYSAIVEEARNYIKKIGGFEKFAEWGLIR